MKFNSYQIMGSFLIGDQATKSTSKFKKIICKQGFYFLILALWLLPIAKIFSLHSNFFDLGVFENIGYRVVMFNEFQAIFSGHAQWYLLIYSYLASIFPYETTPFFLVSIQSSLMLAPAFYFRRTFGDFFGLVYCLLCPLWAYTLFDFHPDHLAVPLMVIFYMALLKGRFVWAVLSATLVVFIKEPFALQSVGCGILMFMAAFKNQLIWSRRLNSTQKYQLIAGGIWLTGFGFGYFYFSINYLLPYFSPEGWSGSLNGDAFGWLGSGVGDILKTLLTKPYLIAFDIFSTPGKLIYLAILFAPLCFIPLLNPFFLIPAVPLIAIAMLSHTKNYYDPNAHYMVGLIIPIFFSFIYSLPRAKRIWLFLILSYGVPKKSMRPNFFSGTLLRYRQYFYIVLVSLVIVANVMMSISPISRLFWTDKIWSYGWRAYITTERDLLIKQAIKIYIPDDVDVIVSTQNTINYSYLAHRKTYLSFPQGINESINVVGESNRTWSGFGKFVLTGYKAPEISNSRYADFLVIDLKRPWFLVDKGCDWTYGDCQNSNVKNEFQDIIGLSRKYYEIVFERDGFFIFRRRLTL